jgi:GNAT superfamily N-acetyltransferase
MNAVVSNAVVPNRAIPIFEASQPGFTISTDPLRLEVSTIHRFLSTEAYWCLGIPLEVVEKAIAHSLCFGVYTVVPNQNDGANRQVGFARIITDFATYAYLCDVFILSEYRGRGLGKWLVGCIRGHPHLQGLRRWSLATRDAHSLYAQFGFQPVTNPERLMIIADPDVYKR